MLGAPVLRGQAGSLIALMDACLVNGWGIQTASSVVVSGGVCTMTFPLDHAAPVEAVVLVAGSSIADLNGEQKVTAVAANVIKFATAVANGTATGTITAKMAPAGWEKRFSGTNLAVYRSLDLTGNRFNLRVNDTNAIDTRILGYETMTTVSAGTGIFPTSTQQSGGLYLTKAYAAGADVIPWVLIANTKRLYLGNAWAASPGYGGPTYTAMAIHGFGDFPSLKSTVDSFNCMIAGETGTNQMYANFGLALHANPGLYMARGNAGTGSSVTAEQIPGYASGSGEGSGNATTFGVFPGNTGKLMLASPGLAVTPVSSNGIRSVLTEVLHCPQAILQASKIPPFDTISGQGLTLGRRLLAIPATASPIDPTAQPYHPAAFFDITGPWA